MHPQVVCAGWGAPAGGWGWVHGAEGDNLYVMGGNEEERFLFLLVDSSSSGVGGYCLIHMCLVRSGAACNGCYHAYTNTNCTWVCTYTKNPHMSKPPPPRSKHSQNNHTREPRTPNPRNPHNHTPCGAPPPPLGTQHSAFPWAPTQQHTHHKTNPPLVCW